MQRFAVVENRAVLLLHEKTAGHIPGGAAVLFSAWAG
jgi:hypothetical protein